MVGTIKELDKAIIALDKMALAIINEDKLIGIRFTYELPNDQEQKKPVLDGDGSLIKRDDSNAAANEYLSAHARIMQHMRSHFLGNSINIPVPSTASAFITLEERLSVEVTLGIIGLIISDKKAQIEAIKKQIVNLGFNL